MRSILGRAGTVAAMVTALTLSAASSIAQSLEREIQSVLSQARLGSAQVGVSVQDAGTGEPLASINERAALAPASNLKLLTSGTALLVLGKDFEFRTRIVRDGDRLVIVGSGDPALADPKLLAKMGLTLEQFLDRIAASIRDSGVTGVREIVVDDRVFDRDTIHASWPKNQLNLWYCAPVTGLNFHTNVLEIYPSAGQRAGNAPTVRTVPSARWIELVNRARTVAAGSTSLWAAQEPGAEFRFTLYGELRAAPEEPIEVTVREPGLLLARLLADRVGRLGLGIAGATPTVRPAADGEAAPAGPTVALVRTPISEILERCNTDSQNLYAEALLKRLGNVVTGQPGSWSNGSTVVRMQINEKLGPEAGDLVMTDGSGLARDNRVTPVMLASWLGILYRDPNLSPLFVRSMASSAEGRLRQRFKDKKLTNEVHAKTGFIRGVLCLSGYVVNPSTGRAAAFSILVNNFPDNVPASRVKEFHDEVVFAVDRWLSRQPALQATVPALGG
ncbi:MAG: D-alanyl-D-alanine carboxypeptidase/D-alanyl-D-alanine-endopeptidase [Phycisphaerae bacterium]|nr:D-alanyl-D-alanine carboxypeptidase/D-alanyl-D-alanine-endopeptidase [Phycisphaerae bacterium]